MKEEGILRYLEIHRSNLLGLNLAFRYIVRSNDLNGFAARANACTFHNSRNGVS